jgi:hypothetical protein
MYSNENPLSVLTNRTIEKIELGDEHMLITCTDGEVFQAYHMQDCCEHVRIYDTQGDVNDLIGSRIIAASEEADNAYPDDIPEPKYTDSFTWTLHRFETESGKVVVVRWLGESNGYYSERVHFGRTHPRIDGFSID